MWADKAGQYHGAGWLHHLIANFYETYGVRASMQFGPPGENKEEVDALFGRLSSHLRNYIKVGRRITGDPTEFFEYYPGATVA